MSGCNANGGPLHGPRSTRPRARSAASPPSMARRCVHGPRSIRTCAGRRREARITTGGSMPGLLLLLAMLLGAGCAPADRPDPPGGPVAALDETPPPVMLPDLSPIAAWAQDQIRERYAALQALLETSADARTPPTSALAAAYGELGLILMATRYYAASADALHHARVLAPDDRRWPYYLGHLHRLREDRATAAAWLERALGLAPTDEATLIWLGRIYLDQGRPEDGDRIFAHAAAAAPDSAAAWAGVGLAAVARRDYLRATEALERAVALDPQASSLRYPLATAYRALGRMETAAAHLELRGARLPGFADPLLARFHDALEGAMVFERRGNQALSSGDLPAAIAFFRRGLALEPDDPTLQHRLATALAMNGDLAGAAAQIEATLRQTPDFSAAHNTLATIRMLEGRLREAVERYTIALEHDPDYVEARLGLAEVLRTTGRTEDSLAHYVRVTAFDPGFLDAWIGRAEALVALRRYREARDWLNDALRVHPNRPELAQLVERIAAAPDQR